MGSWRHASRGALVDLSDKVVEMRVEADALAVFARGVRPGPPCSVCALKRRHPVIWSQIIEARGRDISAETVARWLSKLGKKVSAYMLRHHFNYHEDAQ